MKYFLIDEISGPDMEKLSAHLRDIGEASGLEGVFWIKMPEEYLDGIQSGHGECKPYVFAVELGAGAAKAEFFIRSLKGMKCSCSVYANPGQIMFIIRFINEMIRELGIGT
jgi:hypothetical protein